MKILLVDDETRNLKLLEAMLAPEGYGLLTASSGEQALQLLAEQTVNMAILDVMMPGMSGYEACDRIKTDPDTAGIPVIMLTAKDMGDDKEAVIRKKADSFIVKPFDSDGLIKRINKLISKKCGG